MPRLLVRCGAAAFAAVLALMTVSAWAQSTKPRTASAAEMAACEKIRRERAEGAEARGLESSSSVSAAAAGGMAGAIIGAVVAAGINHAAAEQAYQDCLAGKRVQPVSTGPASKPAEDASVPGSATQGAAGAHKRVPLVPTVRGSCPHLPPHLQRRARQL